MRKFSLVLVIALFVFGLWRSNTVSAQLNRQLIPEHQRDGATVDPEIWQRISTSSVRKTRIGVHLDQDVTHAVPSGTEGRVERPLTQILDALQDAGAIDAYRFDPEQPVIYVEASTRAVRLLASLPGITSITAEESDAETSSVLLTPQDDTAPGAISASGRITGTVTGPDGVTPLESITVEAQRYTGSIWVIENSTTTSSDGGYVIGALPTASYRVRFFDPDGVYVREYYDDRRDAPSDPSYLVTVFDGQTVSDIDASLALAGFISGRVTSIGDGSGVVDIVAIAQQYRDGAWRLDGTGTTAEDGTYTIRGLAAGSYVIRFEDPYEFPRYLEEYYDNVLDFDSATPVTVNANATTPGIDADLGEYGSISGTVASAVNVEGVVGIDVSIWHYNVSGGYWEFASWAETDANGLYRAPGLDTGDYRVEFSDPGGQYVGEYYNDAASRDVADDVSVDLGLTTSNIDAVLSLALDALTQSLAQGWNLISFPVVLDDPTMPSALETVSGTASVAWAHDVCTTDPDPWLKYDPNDPLSELTTVDTTHGYWIDLTSSADLTVTGTHPISTVISLCTGWNLIGYASVNAKPVTEVLAPISGQYDLVYGFDGADTADPWKKYNPSVPVGNDLEDLTPGYGYWIRMTAPATLTIPGR
jgi:hypothetical protein